MTAPSRRAAIAALRQIPPERLRVAALMLGGEAGQLLEGLAGVVGRADEQVEAWLSERVGSRPDAATLGALRVLVDRVAPAAERLTALRAATARVADAERRVGEAAAAWASERDAELAALIGRAQVQSAQAMRDAEAAAEAAEAATALVTELGATLELGMGEGYGLLHGRDGARSQASDDPTAAAQREQSARKGAPLGEASGRFAKSASVGGGAPGVAGPRGDRVMSQAFDEETLLGLSARVQGLEGQAARLEGVRGRLDGLRSLVDDLAAWALRRDRPDASSLLVLAASVSDELKEPPSARFERWRRAFERAASEGRLDVARAAGQRAQLLAVELGETGRVASIAERLATLAASAGDLRASVLARLEVAVALVQDRGQRAAAVRAAREAVEAARAGDAGLQARAQLVLGQVLDRSGDAEGARRAWREAMEVGRESPAELMRAALALGRSQVVHQPHQARRNLALARELAERHGQADVLAHATLALLTLDPSDAERAGGWVRMARAALGATEGWRVMRRALEDKHGARQVEAWLREPSS